MTRQIHEVPPAPRRVRTAGLLTLRWPLLVVALVLAVYGGLWTLMLTIANDTPQRAVGDLATWILCLAVVPGIVCGLLWVLGVVRLQRLLRTGDVAVAEIVELRRVRRLTPPTLWVRFRFRDHHARPHEGWHWVPERSALGDRLLAGDRRSVVVHDRARPWQHRLAQPSDFVTADEPVEPRRKFAR